MISRGYLKDVEPKEISWLWRPYIAFGKVTLIQGDTGIGKTSLMVKVMADLSNGLYPPTMFRERLLPQETGDPITTYYVSIENGIADTIVPLFNRVGGNNEFVQYQDEMKEHFVLTGDEVRECVRISGAKLIVVDPWQQFLDDASSSDNNAMRAMIRDVQNAAEETGAAVVLCGNYTKAVVRSDMGKGIGASELFNTLRSVLTVKYGDSPSERCMIASKMSFLGKEVTPVRFVQDEDYRKSYVFDDEVDELEAGEEVVESASKADLTAAFLADLLKDGPMDSNDVKRAVQASGFSMTTVQRVKDKIVVVERQPNKSSTWMLR
jgi:hypothetical protein